MEDSPHVYYKSGFKYQITRIIYYQTTCVSAPSKYYSSGFLKITKGGMLTILPGYATDGPSGPTCDTTSVMRGAIIHDALSQLARNSIIDESGIDEELAVVLRQDNVSAARIWLWMKGLSLSSGSYMDPSNKKKEHESP